MQSTQRKYWKKKQQKKKKQVHAEESLPRRAGAENAEKEDPRY